jgi:hypothetical protein
MIIVILLSGAVALSASSLRATTYDANYHEAEHIGEILAEKITLAKSTGRVDFAKGVTASLSEPFFSVGCFDADNIVNILSSTTGSNCKDSTGKIRQELPYPDDRARYNDADNYVYVRSSDKKVPFDNSSFENDFFRWKIDLISRPGSAVGSRCPSISGVSIPDSKCRAALISVKWEQPSGTQTYRFIQYFADWEK